MTVLKLLFYNLTLMQVWKTKIVSLEEQDARRDLVVVQDLMMQVVECLGNLQHD
jgi:hypothetical protein